MSRISPTLVAAAAVAAGETVPAGIEVEDPASVVEVLRQNKVPMLDLGAVPPWLAGSDAWRAAVADERESREALGHEYHAVARRLEAAGIEPVLFKATGGFPYQSSNLDTLVSPSLMEEAARILLEAGHVRLPNYREDHKLLFHRFRKGVSVISVHLHGMVSWGKVPILDGDDVIARSRPSTDGMCRIASAEDLLMTSLAHALYETDELRLSDMRGLRLFAGTNGFDWDAIRERVEATGWNVGFSAALRLAVALEKTLYGDTVVPVDQRERARHVLSGAAWARRYVNRVEARLDASPPERLPYPLSKVYSKMHTINRIATEPSRTPDERVVDLLATGWNLVANRLRLRCRPAVILSLSGLDGAGKSTVAEAMLAALRTCEIPVRVVWSRGGFSTWMEVVKRGTRAALPGQVPGPADSEAKRRWLSRPVFGAVFAGVVLMEQTLHHAVKVLIPRAFGVTVLCDRYTYDTAADLLTKTPGWAGRRAGEVLIAIVRRPDLPIVLSLSPAAADRRKPDDVPPHRLVTQARALGDLSLRYGLYEVEADRSDEEVVDEVVDAALRTVFGRFEGKGR